MALRNIVVSDDPILKKVCRPVVKFDDRLAQLLEDMGETMRDAYGLGLAAPQVGVLRRLFVALQENEDDELWEEMSKRGEEPPSKILEFINPEILEQKGEELAYEGCLSYPGDYGAICRPTWVKVRAFDRNGKEFMMEAEGLMARCICHETNHLDGVTIEDLADYFYDPDHPGELDEDYIEEEADR